MNYFTFQNISHAIVLELQVLYWPNVFKFLSYICTFFLCFVYVWKVDFCNSVFWVWKLFMCNSLFFQFPPNFSLFEFLLKSIVLPKCFSLCNISFIEFYSFCWKVKFCISILVQFFLSFKKVSFCLCVFFCFREYFYFIFSILLDFLKFFSRA